jgi:hypothetical protein
VSLVVDLVKCYCKALGLDDHSALAPDLSRGEGGGYISREGAIALAIELLQDAGVEFVLAINSRARKQAFSEGYEAGFRAALSLSKNGVGTGEQGG